MRTVSTRSLCAAALAALTLLAAACTSPPPPYPSPHTGGVNPDLVSGASFAAYVAPGPYAAAVTTVEIEPGRKMEVWYPTPKAGAIGQTPDTYNLRSFLPAVITDTLPASIQPTFTTDGFRDLPAAAGGPFPMVLFSHGAISYRLQSSFLTTHLASWGFVVISPDYFERGIQTLLGIAPSPSAGRTSEQVTQLAVDAAIALNTGVGTLAGKIDTSRLFPIGHSAGGSQSTSLAGSRTDVQSWIAMSSGVNLNPSIFNPNPTVPESLANPNKSVMWITGENDGIAGLDSVNNAYNYSAGERKLVTVPLSGHNNAMTDICEIARPEGGLVGLAAAAGLFFPDFVTGLANDGCSSPPFYTGPQVWPIVRHFVTAELRYRSGLDPQPIGLGAGVVTQLGPIVPFYNHSE